MILERHSSFIRALFEVPSTPLPGARTKFESHSSFVRVAGLSHSIDAIVLMMMPAPKPYRSKLIPFEAEIAVLRRRRHPTRYSQVVQILKEKYGLAVRVSTLFNFVKVRKRWDRVHSSDGVPATNFSMSPKPVRPEQVEKTSVAIERTPSDPLVQQPASSRRRFMSSFTPGDRYNLHRLTPDEKAAYIKKLEAQEEN
jgi:hypothetical protein